MNSGVTPTSLLAIDELCVAYQTRTGMIPAVNNVSLHVQAGECVGLVGESWCGKSTVAGWLRQLGVAVIDLDAVARQIRNNDAEARRRIEARFGTIDSPQPVWPSSVVTRTKIQRGGTRNVSIAVMRAT